MPNARPSTAVTSLPLSLVLILAGALAVTPASAAIYTVGADGDAACTHHNLQAALLSAAVAGNDEVRVATNRSYLNEVVHLTNWGAGNALIISGGYDDCADATPSGTTTIDGTGNPVVEVDTSGANTSNVTLRRLLLTGSTARGLLVEGNSTVTLERTVVSGNSGGGIDVTAGATLTVDFYSLVAGNSTGLSGGGIRCAGGHVLLSGMVGVAGQPNVALSSGGGIFADQGCDLDLLDGAVVQSNQADNGAGIYASAGSSVNANGAANRISINNNAAQDYGGGVYATDDGTTVRLVNVAVAANSAWRGGGLAAASDATITIDQTAASCADVDDCSRLTANTLVPRGGTEGAAGYVLPLGQIDVYETLVDSNRTANLGATVGNVFAAIGGNTRLRFEGVTFHLNEAADLVLVNGGARAEVAFVTASRNGRVPPFTSPARPLVVGDGSTATLNSSIFWPNAAFTVNPGGAIEEADCLIVSSTAGLPGSATLISTLDPQFRNAAVGDLRPDELSPAVDFCDSSLYAPTHPDRDGESRGFDVPANVNGSPGIPGGTLDLGADEMRDLLLRDGFEGGNTNAWTARWPS